MQERSRDYFSPRYIYARNFIHHAIWKVTGSRAFFAMWTAYHAGHHLAASALFAVYERPHGAWDWKDKLQGPLIRKKNIHGEYGMYTRVTKHLQIYYNVWANLAFGYVGRDIGFSGRWLQDWANIAAILEYTNTEGNRIERQIGINMFNWDNTYADWAIDGSIGRLLPRLSHYCDVLPFPSYSGRCPHHEKW